MKEQKFLDPMMLMFIAVSKLKNRWFRRPIMDLLMPSVFIVWFLIKLHK